MQMQLRPGKGLPCFNLKGTQALIVAFIAGAVLFAVVRSRIKVT